MPCLGHRMAINPEPSNEDRQQLKTLENGLDEIRRKNQKKRNAMTRSSSDESTNGKNQTRITHFFQLLITCKSLK